MAARKYLLAIDAGSSGCRALIFDTAGSTVSSASCRWTYDSPAEVAPLGKEFNPQAFWDAVCRVIRQSVIEAGISPSDIVALSSASQREGLVFLDRDGNELYGGPNTDLRAVMEGLSIDAERGDELRRITGHSPSFLFAPAKLQWFKTNRPEVYSRIATILTINNWILYRLSGECVAEPSSDSDTGLVDIAASCWSSRLREAFGLGEGVCPAMHSAGSVVGTVTEGAASQTGLAPGTLAVVGGADTQCGLLGMGVVSQGQVGVVAGWSATVQMVTDEPIVDSSGRIWSSCHVVPRKWILESNAAEAGGAYAWLGRCLFGGADPEQDTYAVMDRLASEAPAGSAGIVAFVGPRAMDMTRLKPLLGGIFFPITPSVTGVERKHIIRAVLENLSFAIKANCQQLRETSGLNVASLSVGGGLARSHILGHILADAMAMPVRYYREAEVTSLGAAMCAAVGAGVYPDLVKASGAMCPSPELVSPDPDRAEQYTAYYSKWVKFAKRLDSLGEEMI
ncbi:MAG: FGGY family carbohydrate kinase [Dehalococcoidia bacterium]|nr:FGGY family carbohydrate kinase [Dehalococcoidia bacterium]